VQERAPLTAHAADRDRLGRFDAWVHKCVAALAATPARGAAALVLLCLALYLPGFADMPVTDRDEGRFVQATTQMLETGDVIDIRFQDEPRYQKPVGIYWLQSITASVFGDLDQREIWTYRVPSLLGAIAAVLALWWAARPVFGREVALIAAALFAACVTMNLEARIAKSDGALIAAIALAQGALMRLYLLRTPLRETVGLAALFWISLAIGILIKGPVAPAVAALTVTALAIFGGARGWLRRLHAPWGIPLLLTITLPWFIAIGIISEGQFYALSLGKDFGEKIGGGQDVHWGPPGFYFVLFWWTFWPAALVATGGAAIWLWRNRAIRRAAFLLAWIVPYWLVIEAVPTKLPHYALPIYPAVALAAVWVLRTQTSRGMVPMRTYKQAAGLWLGIGVLQVVVFAAALWLFETTPSVLSIVLAAVFAVAAPLTAVAIWRRAFHAGLALALVSALAAYTGIIGEVLPRLTPLWNSERIAELRAAVAPCYGGPVALSGYREPSAVFHLGTETPLLGGESAARWLGEQAGRLAVVTTEEQAEFDRGVARSATRVTGPIACFTGFNMNGGDVLGFRLYASGERAARCPIPEQYRCTQHPEPRWAQILR